MPSVELLVTGRIATLAGDAGFGWVEALAIGEGSVLAAGRRHEVEALGDAATRRLRLAADQVVLPALTDAHLHLVDAALAGDELDLTDLDEGTALGRVAALHAARLAAGDRNGWLLGSGWSLDAFGHWPTADALEAVAPGRPIALWAHDGHTRWLSRSALARAGIDRSTTDVPGGWLRRDDRGEPTGILHEHAGRLVEPAIPERDEQAIVAALERYASDLAAFGIVGCHDPGEFIPDASLRRGPTLLARLARDGRLPIRVHASVRDVQLEAAIEQGLRSGDGIGPIDARDGRARRLAERFRVGWLKLFADGSLGSRTAALLAPYEPGDGEPTSSGAAGALLSEPAELAALLARAARAGLSGQVHAIGDRAVRVALDAIEAARLIAAMPVPPRIEHVQLVDPSDLPRFAALGVTASVQPAHLRTDAETARRAWGSRTADSYPYRRLADSGALVALGSDAPIEPADPWPGLALAVSRRHVDWPADAPPFEPGERLDLARAIRAACLDPILAAGEEGRGGRLLPGHRADLIVVPAAALTDPQESAPALARTRPRVTILDGEEIYRDPSFDA